MKGVPGRSGQATVEYILLLAIIGGLFVSMFAGLKNVNLLAILRDALIKDFGHAYQYGNPKAVGPDQGGEGHPRYPKGAQGDIRIFYVRQ